MHTSSSSHLNENPFTWYSTFHSSNQSRNQQYQIGIKSLLLQEEWEVSQTLYSKLNREKLWYLVECKSLSQDPERTTWEPTENLKKFPDPVKKIHQSYP
ncbi:hypothetical protein O181_059453 [Austropuccinia psidii MF-1]|uniref:Chromo domain-containing protein n=1 Tax=Austropuccinia psidii MF-1 TaxID=1389203 RepID=A0A9Q3EEV3_9BASI|nr:hypothetical protein [Austropuccinia psidii MF-1]